MNRSGSRDHAGLDELVERTLTRARMAREPSVVDKERVFMALSEYLDEAAEAGPDASSASGVRQIAQCPIAQCPTVQSSTVLSSTALSPTAQPQIAPPSVQHAARYAAFSVPKLSSLQKLSSFARRARPWAAAPAALQMLLWVGTVGAVTGGLGFWIGSQPELSNTGAAAVAPVAPIRAAAPKAVASRAHQRSAEEARSVAPVRGEPSAASEPAAQGRPIEPEALLPGAIAPRAIAPEGKRPALPEGSTRAVTPSQAASPGAAFGTSSTSAEPPRGRVSATPPGAPVPSSAASPTPERASSADPSELAASTQAYRRLVAATAPPVPQAVPAPREVPLAGVTPLPASGAAATPRLLAPPQPAERPLPAAPGGSAPGVANARFLEAVRTLQRAQRAVERGAPIAALSLLDELDARFPFALLNEERLATRVLALCASGALVRAKRVAAELVAQSPSSIYAARIAQSCAGSAARPAPRH